MFFAAVLPLLATPLAYAKTSVVSASIFKNNYALVTHRIDVPVSGIIWLDALPRSALGTLWFESSGGLRMKSITATDAESDGSFQLGDNISLLTANVGKRVKLLFSDKTPSATGKLISVSEKTTVLDEGGATGVYSTEHISSFKVLDVAKTTSVSHLRRRVLRIVVGGNRSGSLYYTDLEPGLNWAPAYALDISDRSKLKFTSGATIIDDLAPLSGIETKLVTGIPSNLNLGELDPLVAAPTYLLPPGHGYVPQGITRSAYDATDNSIIVMGGAPLATKSEVGGNNPAGTGEGDLFFYRQTNVSLQPGERGYFILGEGNVDYTETYTWTGHDPIYGGNSVRDNSPIGASVDTSEVIHGLRFVNVSGQPLTSGPASIYRDGQLIGQNNMPYTPKSGTAEVRINNALDVHVEARDEETARDRAAKKITDKTTADLLSLKTTVEIQNFKEEAITITVRRPFTGDVQDPEGGKVSYDRTSTFALNRSGTIEWQVQLAAGATKSLTFSSKAYVLTGSGT